MDEACGDDGWSQEFIISQGLFALMKAISDTGFIIAFKNRNDQHHRWALDLARHVDMPLLTCESVLSEATFHLGSSEAVMALVSAGMLQVSFDFDQNVEKLHQLAARYADRSPDLADLCLIRMSELHPHHTVITVDDDFRVYRRNKREAIPMLCPPRR